MNSLYLTQAEQELFSALPESLRDGWKVEREKIDYVDSQEKQRVRCKFMKLSSGLHTVPPIASQSAFEDWVSSLDLARLTDDDLREIFYALGPISIGRILERTIPLIQTDSDIEGVAAIALLRHIIFTPLKK